MPRHRHTGQPTLHSQPITTWSPVHHGTTTPSPHHEMPCHNIQDTRRECEINNAVTTTPSPHATTLSRHTTPSACHDAVTMTLTLSLHRDAITAPQHRHHSMTPSPVTARCHHITMPAPCHDAVTVCATTSSACHDIVCVPRRRRHTMTPMPPPRHDAVTAPQRRHNSMTRAVTSDNTLSPRDHAVTVPRRRHSVCHDIVGVPQRRHHTMTLMPPPHHDAVTSARRHDCATIPGARCGVFALGCGRHVCAAAHLREPVMESGVTAPWWPCRLDDVGGGGE